MFVPSGHNVHLLDGDHYGAVSSLNGHYSDVTCCVYNEARQELYSGGMDRNVIIWESDLEQSEAYGEHLREQKGSDERQDMLKENTVTADNWSDDDDDYSDED